MRTQAPLTSESISPDEVLSLVDRLVDKGLAIWDQGGRYRLLNTVQMYARARLAESPEEDTIQTLHFRVYEAFAKGAEEKVRGPDQHYWMPVFESENGNFRAALDYGFACEELRTAAMEMTFNITPFWFIRGYLRMGISYYERALEACPSDPSDLRAKLLRRCGMLCMYAGGDDAGCLLEEALEMSEKVGSPGTLADAHFTLGAFLQLKNRFDLAVPHFKIALSMFEELGDGFGIAFALSILGNIALIEGRSDEAKAYFNQVLELRKRTGDDRGIGATLASLGLLELHAGNIEAARTHLAEALPLLAAAGDIVNLAAALPVIARLECHRGRFAEAARLLGYSAALMEGVGAVRDSLEQLEFETTRTAVEAALGKHLYKEFAAEGAGFTFDEAIHLATECLNQTES